MGPWCLVLRVNQAACPAMAPGALGFPKPWGYDLAVAPQFGKPPNDWRWAAAISSGNGGCLYEQTFLSYSAAPALQTYAILQSGFFRLNVEGWLHDVFGVFLTLHYQMGQLTFEIHILGVEKTMVSRCFQIFPFILSTRTAKSTCQGSALDLT